MSDFTHVCFVQKIISLKGSQEIIGSSDPGILLIHLN